MRLSCLKYVVVNIVYDVPRHWGIPTSPIQCAKEETFVDMWVSELRVHAY